MISKKNFFLRKHLRKYAELSVYLSRAKLSLRAELPDVRVAN